jgi:hypothetical protein
MIILAIDFFFFVLKVAKFSLKNFSSKIKKGKSGLVWANSLYTLAAISHARALLFYRMR